MWMIFTCPHFIENKRISSRQFFWNGDQHLLVSAMSGHEFYICDNQHSILRSTWENGQRSFSMLNGQGSSASQINFTVIAAGTF